MNRFGRVLVGIGARRVTRWTTAVVLVGAIASGTAGTAFGYAEGGIDVPDSTFRQGTGTQEITVSLAAPVVGSDEKFVVWPFYSTADHWLVGVTADASTGASCSYDVGQWQCVPGRRGWQSGALHVLVNTGKAMDCGLHTGVCQTDEVAVQSLPDPGDDHNGLPDGQAISVLGNVVIMPASVPWSGPTAPVYKQPLLAPTTSAPAPDPVTSVDAEKTSVAVPSGGFSPLVYAALALLILIGVSFPILYRRRHRRD
ncbi:MAG TPA: hypothetical protein VFN97_06130 [Actinospica sp.]|nr:hypothetical protein [Actinospica sp.]